MKNEERPEQLEGDPAETESSRDEIRLSSRRDFLRGLKKWSVAVIGAVLLSEALPGSEVAAWVNRRGSWVNGGGSWLNSGTNWINRGGSWLNGGGGWINRGGGGWLNARGGGGGSWVNRRG